MESTLSANETPPVIDKDALANQLVETALMEINARYGSGEPGQQNAKEYHNVVHTKDVIEAAVAIAKYMKQTDASLISDDDIALLKIAAAYHDIELGVKSGINELRSAERAAEAMRKLGFRDEEITKVKSMIGATMVTFDQGILKHVQAGSLLDEIMQDADLAHLGKEASVYQDRFERYLAEETGKWRSANKDVSEAADGQAETEFRMHMLKAQIVLLHHFEFKTSGAKQLYPHKDGAIEATGKMMDVLFSA